MRLREKDLAPVYLKKRIVIRDEEGEKQVVYSPDSTELLMNVQSAGGMVNAQIYGERLPYIKSCKYQGNQLVAGENENDGVCVYVPKEDEPDYFIKAMQPFRTHVNVTLEKKV